MDSWMWACFAFASAETIVTRPAVTSIATTVVISTDMAVSLDSSRDYLVIGFAVASTAYVAVKGTPWMLCSATALATNCMDPA